MGVNDDEDSLGDAGETIAVDRSAIEEHTVVVQREAPEEHTVVVDREDAAEHTVVVDRGDAGELTVVVDRGAPEADPASTSLRVKRVSALDKLPRPSRRRTLTLAPGDDGTNLSATPAVGPGAVDSYVPRQVPAPPPAASTLLSGSEVTRPEATRTAAPSMPSVARHSRKLGLVALTAAVIACVVSVVGLVAIVVLLLNS
jgi:hypothetical protein